MRWIYISPHLDDAVLSAGGFIYEQTRAGIPVEVWTCMCGFPPEGEVSPLAQVLHFQWGFPSAEETVRSRRAEDVKAITSLGATPVHFDFLDCIYRRGKDGEWLYTMDVFVPPHADEADLPAQVARVISDRLQPDDVLVCQFGIGSHVDHVAVRRALELLGRPLLYAADIPYLFDHPQELTPNAAGMDAKVYPVSEASLEAWQEAALSYQSQIEILFETPTRMQELIRSYCLDNLGVRLWQSNANHRT